MSEKRCLRCGQHVMDDYPPTCPNCKCVVYCSNHCRREMETSHNLTCINDTTKTMSESIRFGANKIIEYHDDHPKSHEYVIDLTRAYLMLDEKLSFKVLHQGHAEYQCIQCHALISSYNKLYPKHKFNRTLTFNRKNIVVKAPLCLSCNYHTNIEDPKTIMCTTHLCSLEFCIRNLENNYRPGFIEFLICVRARGFSMLPLDMRKMIWRLVTECPCVNPDNIQKYKIDTVS